jgi:MFS transporter, ACS family, solute carrier family 17 (sodium-dependent inorganic phosphate cotransporter), member 6/7/8
VGMCWYVLWHFFCFETPATHPTISQAERIFIEESIGEAGPVRAGPMVNDHLQYFFNQVERHISSTFIFHSSFFPSFQRFWTGHLLLFTLTIKTTA